MQRFIVIAGLALATQVCAAQSKMKPMTDGAMEHVTAAGMTASVNKGVVTFQGQVPTAKGLVTSAGSLAIQSGSTNNTTGTLTLNGNAQQNLNSLVNINAVNSKINVLLNLNVNINSTVGTLTQTNLTAKH
jgi:hypothetical protein